MSPAGFDCSGFVKYCCSLMGINMNRVAADQALNGYEVPVGSMLPGDILCFSSSLGGSYIGHTGIYVGNGYFIHSPRTGYNVEIVALSETSYGQRIANIRRIF
jgi:N-acetylmuramoyl-L-alanine amidase